MLRYRKKILEISLYEKIFILGRFQDIFPLKRPIPENVTGFNPIPVAFWLNIYLTDINVSRKSETELQKKKMKLLYMIK